VSIFLGEICKPNYNARAMTRTSIEAAAKIFIVALIVVFIWTVIKVMAQLGWA
jgi:hypothetical protein